MAQSTMKDKIYFRSISLKNVRCFGSEQTMYFTKNNQSDGEISMWNVILGENGVGKTTVLREMVSFLDRDTISYPLIRKEEKLSLKVHIAFEKLDSNTSKNYSTNINIADTDEERELDGYFWYPTPSTDESRKIVNNLRCFAYGANRKVSDGLLGNYNFTNTSRIINLFNENNLLLNATEWLLQTEYLAFKEKKYERRFEIVKNTLIKLLDNQVLDIYTDVVSGTPKVFFKTLYGAVKLQDLSLGFKTLIAWITDFSRGLFEFYPESEDPLSEPAICLVDEIDLHMHPKMQRSVVKFLRKTFPQTQFIVTAHSPLIVQSEEDTNVILLRRKDNEVEVVNDMDYVTNWRIDQILTSDLFGVSAYSPTIETTLNKRREIMVKDNPTEAEKKILSEIDNSIENLSVVESPEYIQTVKLIERLRSHAES
jgi:predicted ATP-binding protein involved in virulence